MCIKKGAQAKAKTNNFTRFVLKPLWEVNEVVRICFIRDAFAQKVLQRGDKEQISRLIASLGVKVSPRDAQGEPRAETYSCLHIYSR